MQQDATASPATATVRLLVPPRAADQIVPVRLRPLLPRLRRRAGVALADRISTLGRALVVARIVHSALPASSTCSDYATVMHALAREFDVPARITFGGSAFNSFDTHTTVEVWRTRDQSWEIVDPTFGGTFTRGPSSRPLGSIDLRRALLEGWSSQIVWHPAAPDSRPLSSYHVDPTSLFRYVGVYVQTRGHVHPLVAPDSGPLIRRGRVFVLSPSAIAETSPRSRAIARFGSIAGLSGRPRHATLPPQYAPHELARQQVHLPTTVHIPNRGSIVVWTSVPGVRIAGYRSMRVNDGSLSPIFPVSEVNATFKLAGEGRALVRIFRARTFPQARER